MQAQYNFVRGQGCIRLLRLCLVREISRILMSTPNELDTEH